MSATDPPPSAEQMERAIRILQAAVATTALGILAVAALYVLARWR